MGEMPNGSLAVPEVDVARGFGWRVVVQALCISLFVLVLFYYWFGIADPYAILLYGPGAIQQKPAEPFDAITSSRYWMTGFVASGAVLVLYAGAYWMAARLARWRRR